MPLTCVVSRDSARSWEHRKNVEDDPEVEFSSIGCACTSSGTVIFTYLRSRMANSRPLAKLGHDAMSLSGAVVQVD